ncbi:GFA family protein [Exilibacterium tricleocarpae]|uniref:GFA family protein n=1 Tax=Exilibacterium tricleocarpae TaxID=2591008 RepID=A0A545SSP6_9GAMM|nr:GFA family protein [Exilibacterium tricleocarpae]TQV67998.1 GFA family protein [Exilibacterium tricleocarpae]
MSLLKCEVITAAADRKSLSINGSCVCGAIEFEAELIPGMVFNCHCSRCRKSHGAAFATQAFARRETLRFIRGKEHLREYDSTGGIRAFCSHCGSRLMNFAKDGGDYLSIALACVDSAHDAKPVADVCVNSKVDWQPLSDTIPSYPELPDDIAE